jgi:uncharacterized protein (TIGR03067 family)
MRIHAGAALTIAVLLAATNGQCVAEDAKAKAVQKELKKLEGAWQLVSFSTNGQERKVEGPGDRSVVIKGDKWIAAGNEWTATLTIDPAKRPMTISVAVSGGPIAGKVLKGTYRLEGGLLLLAYAVPGETAEALFREYDKNRDGKLSPEEMPETLRLERAKWDANKDGVIDFGEFKEYVRHRLEQSLAKVTSERDSGVAAFVYKRAGQAPADAKRQPDKAEAKRTSAAKWEYRVVKKAQVLELGKNDLTAGLNKLGEEGWELVSVQPPSGSERGGRSSAATEYYFKRPAGAKVAESSATGTGEMRIFRLKYIKAAEAAGVLQDLLGKGPRIVADPSTNQIIVGGPDKVLAEATAILEKLDVAVKDGSGISEFKIFRLKHADAAATAKVLKELMGTGKGIKIIPDDRTNQLLVECSAEDLFKIAKVLQELDVPADKK